MLEESLSDALLAAGERLAEAMRIGLSEAGMPSDVSVVLEEGRVVVASRSAAVRRAELGSSGAPPRAVMEGVARQATPDLLHVISEKLQEIRL